MTENIAPLLDPITFTTDWKGCHTLTMNNQTVDHSIVNHLFTNISGSWSPGDPVPTFHFSSLGEVRTGYPLILRAAGIGAAFDRADRAMSCLQRVCKAVYQFFSREAFFLQDRIAWCAGRANEMATRLHRVGNILQSPRRGAFLHALYLEKRHSVEREATQRPCLGTEEEYRQGSLATYSHLRWRDYFQARSTLLEMDNDPEWASHNLPAQDLSDLNKLIETNNYFL